LAGGAVAWLGAQLRPGIDVVLEQTDFDKALQWADVVITGEGKIDRQSASGKVVSAVIQRTHRASKRVILVCGQAEPEASWPQVTIHSMVGFAGTARSLADPAGTLEELIAGEVAPCL
jgi:glycerate kinase